MVGKLLKIEGVYKEKEDGWGGGKEEGLQCPKRIRFALDNMQVNKNRTIRKQYLVCHESTKKSLGMEKVKTRKSVAVLD